MSCLCWAVAIALPEVVTDGKIDRLLKSRTSTVCFPEGLRFRAAATLTSAGQGNLMTGWLTTVVLMACSPPASMLPPWAACKEPWPAAVRCQNPPAPPLRIPRRSKRSRPPHSAASAGTNKASASGPQRIPTTHTPLCAQCHSYLTLCCVLNQPSSTGDDNLATTKPCHLQALFQCGLLRISRITMPRCS